VSAPAKRIERPYRADPDIARLEQEWWEANAPLVAKVWELNDGVSRVARRRYLRRARRFFATGGGEAHVIELGCGSGWVGQSICGPHVRITGTDFSANQIALARDNAARKQLSGFTHYQMATSGDWPSLDRPPTGVLIHAFLHHLDGAELEEFFGMLHRNLAPGTQVWIYEPAFYARPPAADASAARPSDPAAYRIATAIVSRMSKLYRRFGLIDTDTRDGFSALYARANELGWHLSPKEVPLEMETFNRDIARHVAVSQSYWATAFLIGWIFETNLIKSPGLRALASKSVVRALALLDSQVVRDEEFLRTTFVAPNHGFRVWEGTLLDGS
jgi:2-polyprenyl-3-methyl-5-hydroxy-6-metoxy-1,4-benzoquinol methylase